jgi:hypothetical protein
MTKTCTKCGETYPATFEYFFREKRGKYGLRSKCRACFSAETLINKQKPEVRERALIQGRKYYHENKEEYAEKWQRYYKQNAETIKARASEYGKNNRSKLRLVDARRRENGQFRLSSNISRSIRQSLFRFSGKGGAPWESLVGYTKAELIEHIESRLQPGMTWDNYGEWHLDHIIPVVVFNFTSYEHVDFKRCWALKNLRPMWASENISKGAKLEQDFQPALAM